MKKFIFIPLLFVLLLACRKDHDTDPEIEDGGVVYSSQVVIIETTNLTQEEVSGSLGNETITAYKGSEDELVFVISFGF